MTKQHDHTTFAANLHEVATFIGRLPADVPIPSVTNDLIRFAVYSEVRDEQFRVVRTVPQEVRAIARALGGRWEKNDPEANTFDELYYTLTSAIVVGGRPVQILCSRNDVCERIEVGREKVIVPAKEAQEAEPEREEERPVYRFECRPLNDAAGRELADVLQELEEVQPA
jgi:hypothetical protein